MSTKNYYCCDTCHAQVDHLFQSYKTGDYECASCALNDVMSDEQRRRVELYIQRSEQAKKNFALA